MKAAWKAALTICVCLMAFSLPATAVMAASEPEHDWEKTFGGTENDVANTVLQTRDGGFIIAGTTKADATSSSDMYLVKMDNSGNKEWEKTLGGPETEEAYSVNLTRDGGYIVAGNKWSAATKTDLYLVKIDASGAVATGIEAAKEAGLHPVKINMVLLKGVNENEISDMIKFASENGIILQIIEFESPVESELYAKYHSGLVAVEEALKSKARKVVIRQMHHRKKYSLNSGGEVEIVRPMHNTEFCRYCNRIRVTSDGKLKPCLFRNDNLVDILEPIRKGASQKTLKTFFIKAVNQRKPYFA